MKKSANILYRENAFRVTALFLSLFLSVPNCALAMRQTGLEESDNAKGEMVSQLQRRGTTRREFLAVSAAAAATALSAEPEETLHAQIPAQPETPFAPLVQKMGPRRLLLPAAWGNPSDVLKYPDFFQLAVQQKMNAFFLSGQFSDLPRPTRQAIIDQAKKAKLPILGFMLGSPDWVLKTKRAAMRLRISRLMDALLDLDLGKELQVAFVFDIEPHTDAALAFNGDLSGYSEAIQEADQMVKIFAKQAQTRHKRDILYAHPIVTFEPHWWKNGHPTEKGPVIRNLTRPEGIIVAGMTYQPDTPRISSVAVRTKESAQETPQALMLASVETKKGIQHTFYDREGAIARTLSEVFRNLTRERPELLLGFFIHFGNSDDKVSGIDRAYQVFLKWASQPVQADSKQDTTTSWGVKGNKAQLANPPVTVELEIEVPPEFKKEQFSAAVFRKTDVYYAQSPFLPLDNKGKVILRSPSKRVLVGGDTRGPAAILVIRQKDQAAFMELYKEGRGVYEAAKKFAQAVILIQENGSAEVVPELKRGGLEETPAVVANRIFSEPEVAGALEVSGRALLDSEQVRALGFQAARALLIWEEAHAVEGNHVIFADQRLTNPAAEKLLPWLKVGTTAEEVVAKSKKLNARVGDLVVLQMDQGVSREAVEKLMAAYFPESGDRARAVIGDQARVEGLSVFAFQLLATERGLPSVVVLSVAVRLKDEQGNSYTLVLMA